ncbi:MAG: helix-turn-helix domain-containing protein [Clostridia bacterium]|jgi:transcriptional regulator with XRE-family HTH domain|nr:helix-turn-helix domain-containing protein [Clostridia bacterium]
MSPDETLGTTIRQLRLSKEMTQLDLARKAHVSHTYISKIENNRLGHKQGPGRKVLEKFAQALSDGKSHERLSEKFMLLADKIPDTFVKNILKNRDEILRSPNCEQSIMKLIREMARRE